MQIQPVSPAERLAYYHAGVGVVGHMLGVQVHRVLTYRTGLVSGMPTIEPFDQWAARAASSGGLSDSAIEDYVTVTLAGLAGRLRVAERAFGYKGPCTGQSVLARHYQAKAWEGHDALTDRAFAIAVGWLSASDGGNTRATLGRLWRCADRALSREPGRGQLDRLARRLLAKGELFWPEILAVLSE